MGLPRSVYLDHNATTPPRPEVLEAMREVAARCWANPSSVHRPGQEARRWVDRARAAVAALVGFHRRDVVLCSGGTEANNLALALAPRVVTSRLEHPSIVAVAEARRAHSRWIDVPPDGRLRPEAVEAALAGVDAPMLVAVQAVNHETGVIQPVMAIAEVVHAHGGWLHVDTVQAVGRLGIGTWTGADSVVVAAHKIRGPKGIGALVTRPRAKIAPVLRGGGQERGLRPGTQDASMCAGFALAAEAAVAGPERYRAVAPLRDALEEHARAVAREAGVQVSVNGDASNRAPHVTNLSFDGHPSPEICAALDLLGVAVASGSACAAGTAEPSPVIETMLGRERASSAVRVSLGETTSEADVSAFVDALATVLGRSPS